MNAWLLAVVACIYAWCAFNYWRNGEYGMAIAFVAYALANVGFVVATFEVDKLKVTH